MSKLPALAITALLLGACGSLDSFVQPSFEDDIASLREMCSTLGPTPLLTAPPSE